jgi:hypothetical protein
MKTLIFYFLITTGFGISVQYGDNAARRISSLSSISFSAASVTGGNPLTGTVHLIKAAPPGGAIVTLALNGASDPCIIPSSVTVPPGATSASFPIQTKTVTSNFIETIWGNYGSTQHAAFTMTVETPATFSDNFANLDNWIVSNWTAPGGGKFETAYADVSTGMLRLKLTQDGTTTGSIGGEVQLKTLFGYGRYDYVMRASSTSSTPTGIGVAVSGQISATFNYLPVDANGPDYNSTTEIDAPEIEGVRPNEIQYTVWKDTLESSYATAQIQNPEAGFHKYSFIWSAGQVQFLIDDSLVSTTTANVPTEAAYPMINHWGTNDANFGGLATAGVTRYMYVKSFTFTAD